MQPCAPVTRKRSLCRFIVVSVRSSPIHIGVASDVKQVDFSLRDAQAERDAVLVTDADGVHAVKFSAKLVESELRLIWVSFQSRSTRASRTRSSGCGRCNLSELCSN